MPAGRKKRRLMGEINVVPYIDVMLVLLIIFMITAPLLIQGVDVDLPRLDAEPVDPETLQDTDPITVSVDADGQFYLNVGGEEDQPVDREQIRERVSGILADAPETPVYVRGDNTVPYGRVVSAMTVLQEAGAPSVGLITEPPDRDGGD